MEGGGCEGCVCVTVVYGDGDKGNCPCKMREGQWQFKVEGLSERCCGDQTGKNVRERADECVWMEDMRSLVPYFNDASAF